jgi:hypothetical protein
MVSGRVAVGGVVAAAAVTAREDRPLAGGATTVAVAQAFLAAVYGGWELS